MAQSPHLDTLLSKLRPFQRSAFEFAVYGTDLSDGNGKKGTAYAKQKQNGACEEAGAPYHYNSKQQQQQVAGAGTGRLLLGDEMGLGKVCSVGYL